MGGSGSGKTTLLNTIAGKVSKEHMAIRGDILLNGKKPKIYRKNCQVGFLQQEDHLLPFATVRETLIFAADLRLPSLSKHEKEELVDSSIMEHGLKHCANTSIGDVHGNESGQGGTRGISGGERRRVSAAAQLLTRPDLLICDEVTSGLDAFNALKLVETLNTYAQSSYKTILLSIHQPRSEIFHLLSASGGQLVLLSRGRAVYTGPMESLLPWFVSVGAAPCPTHMNPLDYALDICSSIPLDSTKSSAPNVNIVESPQERTQDHIARSASLWCQVLVLCQRNWLSMRRNALQFWGSLVVHIFLATSVAVVFWRLDGDLEGIRARASVCYLLCAFQPFLSMILAIYKGVGDIEVFERERRGRLYGPAAFVASYSICNLPVIVLYTLVYSLIIYFAVGFRTDSFDYLGWYTLVNILFQWTISALAMLCVSLERNFDRSTLIGGIFFFPFAMSAGFIVPSSQIPYLLRWLKYVSFHRIAYQMIISLEFTNRHFDCPFRQVTADPFDQPFDPVMCLPWDGNAILQGQLEGALHFFPGPTAVLAIHCAVYTVAAWAVLQAKPIDQVSVASNQSPIESQESPRLIARATNRQRYISATYQRWTRCDLVLLRMKSQQFRNPRQTFQKPLLQNLRFVIPPAQFTAILGGSGSGKTTLLDALMRRIPSSVHTSGDIYFNGVKNPSIAKVSTVCGYVRQNDSFLMSHLTVRETLRFAAELGMDKSLSIDSKWSKVEEIIELIGLQECADVMVGTDEAVGCSGGQRRRVSIGIQLAAEPECLLLDEPTSGLDALTALSIIQVLKRIAASGRTVVCAIHQPRVDIWNEFDNVLLLMAEGRLAYAGKADEAIGYFEQVGYPLPRHTNPPDFIIDTMSVNTRSLALQMSSEATIETLAALYQRQQEITHGASSNDASSIQHSYDSLPHGTSMRVSFFGTFNILTRRSFRNAVRQPGSYADRMVQPIAIVLLTALFFWRLDSSSVGLLNRLGLFQQLMGATLAGLMVHTEVFPKERNIALREISDGKYSATSFLVSYMANEIPLSIISACVSAGIVFLVTDLNATITSVASMALVLFAYITTGHSLGIAYSSAVLGSGGLAVAFADSTVLWMSFMAGFLAPKLPRILDYVNYASIFRYSSRILSLNEFRGLSFQDPLVSNMTTASAPPSALSMPFQSGEAVLRFLNFEDSSLEWSVGMVVGLMVLYRTLAWAVLVAKTKYLFSQ
ncbi:P-loop containing nucleoside triphosphate hydrolase protein [Dissophora ornata]|nr:P-loop containing nucleoside triphosphate hydrolase protein [Dissophora ornata]